MLLIYFMVCIIPHYGLICYCGHVYWHFAFVTDGSRDALQHEARHIPDGRVIGLKRGGVFGVLDLVEKLGEAFCVGGTNSSTVQGEKRKLNDDTEVMNRRFML
jgi:hypothetical protein